MMMTTSNKRRMATTALSMLPEEMEMEVLLRLPVKSILRFSAVCRRWAALLSSEEFCAAWTKIADSTTTTEPAAQLVFLSSPPLTDERSNEVSSGDGRLLLTLDGVRGHCPGIALAPCHGLILLHDPLSLSGRYHVFNAATQAAAMLPLHQPSCLNGELLLPSSAGLGFDARTKEHKVVRLFSSDERPGERFGRIKCEVHSIGRGSDRRWRPPSFSAAAADGIVPSTLVMAALFTASWYNMAPVFAGGFLHWLVDPTISKSVDATSMPAPVLSFSVADETFSSWVRPPPFDWDGKGTHLTELDGRLCMVRDLRRNSCLLEIWNYSNGGDCWTLEHRIDLAARHAAGRVDLTEPRYVRVVGGSVGKRKVIFVTTSKCKVVAYDPKSGTLETIHQFGGETSHWETRRSLTKVSLIGKSLTRVH